MRSGQSSQVQFEACEPLEPRVLLSSTLLGVAPSEPLFQYDNTGTLVYSAANDTFDINADPLVFREISGGPLVPVTGAGNVEIHIEVDDAGALIGGVAGDDLIVEGDIDIDGGGVDFSGTLLTGEIVAFGAEDGPGTTDLYDFRFNVTGGLLAGLYAGKDLGVTTTSEQSNFTDDFTVDFNGEAKGNIGAIDPLPASLGDYVWEDLDGDGEQDAGEPGVGNVTVNLKDSGNNVIASTTTAGDGSYSFTDLVPGTYSVQFVEPAGFDFTTPNAAGVDDALDSDADPAMNGMTQQVTLAAGEHNPTLDAGLVVEPPLKGKIGDFVWNDVDMDGIQDAGEDGIEGVTVKLQIHNGTKWVLHDTTTTTNGGMYMFGDLDAGKYRVKVVGPSGFVFSDADQGSDDAVDSDSIAVNSNNVGRTGAIMLAQGEINNTIDAGLYEVPLLASLGDYAWEDLDGDGEQDAGEPGVGNVTVNLKDSGNNVIASTTTAGDGSYSFTDLVPGTYSVQFVEPAGFDFTTPNAAGVDDALDSDADPAMNGMTQQVTLAAGEHNPTLDAGLVVEPPLKGKIGDFVWNDVDMDGIQDAGEDGIEGVTMKLIQVGSGVIATTTTDSTGMYMFGDLDAGEYKIRVMNKDGYVFSDANQGSDDSKDSDVSVVNINYRQTGKIILSEGETNLTIDAGMYEPVDDAKIKGTVWYDENSDGLQNNGDMVSPNCPVYLYEWNNSQWQIVGSTVSDANGYYEFTGLAEGDYLVYVTPVPTGYSYTFQDVYNNGYDNIDSDVNGNGQATVWLSAGDCKDIDAGFCPNPSTIVGTLWYETWCNGVQDNGEAGSSYCPVYLYKWNGSQYEYVASTTTDYYGNYNFTGLSAGSYAVYTVPPSGYYFTYQNATNDAYDSDFDSGGWAYVTLGNGQTADLDAGMCPC